MRQKELNNKKKKFDGSKMVYKGNKELMILENLKQYVFLVMKLEIILLICIWQMRNRTIWQSILKNLNLKQNHKIILILKKSKRECN